MLRRDFGAGILSIAIAGRALGAAAPAKEPLLYLATRDRARVFIFGFGEAQDESWLTPRVRRAFDASSELWLEVSHDAGSEPDAAAKREQLTHDAAGRTFFDVLEPSVRERALAVCDQLGIDNKKIESQRPWSAFYTINGAYWSRHKPAAEQTYVDETLLKLAKDQGKPVRYEMRDQLEFARFMAAMPDAAQSQYIVFLLDFLDDEAAGRNTGAFDWVHGDTAVGERAVTRMRTRTPDLYQVMQVRRNAAWAQRIDSMLSAGGTHFIGIGQMHVLGPDGIAKQLVSRGIVKRSKLVKDPEP